MLWFVFAKLVAETRNEIIHKHVVTHSAKADFCCYVLRTPAPKEMCYNALLNQIDYSAATNLQL